MAISTIGTDSISGLGYGFKNRIINGAMMIDQRNAGASYTQTGGNAYTVDRWADFVSGASVSGKVTIQQNAGSVTPPAGFKTYLGITSTSAYSVLSGDIQTIAQPIEGFNTADLGWGAAGASTVTVSFWVRSSLTGTFGGSILNGAGNYSYPFTYTISSASTWEYKTVTIAGPTSGTWVGATNNVGLYLIFSFGTGTTYKGAAGSWASSGYYGATGETNVTGTNGATFYITGVQLEKGSVATSFDYRPYGTELALCQRYFEKSVAQNSSITAVNLTSWIIPIYSTTVANGVNYATRQFAVTKRASPTVYVYPYGIATNTGRVSTDVGTDLAANSGYVNTVQDSGFSVSNTSGGTLTTGGQNMFIANWYATAEL